ncbi:MAG TPA: trigger factor [Gammaproteobacteria bacterium]|nr:trigger factor [Gammaproteobacteria bacterium]
MTLKIETQEDDQRQLLVTVEVDEKRVRKAMQKAARKNARQLRIPGFRPGKAPYNVVVGYIGAEAIRQDAFSELLPQIFEETLKQVDVEPYAQPTLDDVEHDPMVLKMTIPLEPLVVLGDYREMRREITPVEISDEAVDEALDILVQNEATTEPVERPAESGDEVVIGGKGYLGDDEDEVIFQEEHFHVRLEEDAVFAGTSFVDELVGVSAEEEKTFTITFPDEFEDESDFAGKTATFTLTIHEVLERKVPELNDEFVAEQAGDAETVEALRAEIFDRLQKQAEEQFKNDLLDETIDEMLENVEELVYPKGAVEAEIDRILDGIKGQIDQMGLKWEDYLQLRQETNESLREDAEDDAVTRLERRLVFQKFVEMEKIILTEDEIDAAIEEKLENYDEEMQGYMRPFFEGQGGDMLRNELTMDKIHERLVAILSGTAPDLTEPETVTEDSEEDEESSADEAEETVASPETIAEAVSEDDTQVTDES